MPMNAIGKDYITTGWTLTRSPHGTGVQLSVSGMLGFLVGPQEGNQCPRFDHWHRPSGVGDQSTRHWTHWQSQASLSAQARVG